MPMQARPPDSGIAIIAALWAVALVAVIAISVMHMTGADARLVHGRDRVAQLQVAADGAINIAILALLGPTQTQPSVTGTPFTIRVGQHIAQMRVRDEAGKIDLNMANAEMLQLLLAGSGLTVGEAEEMAGRILDWRSPDPERHSRAGDAAAYAAAGLGYGPRKAPFQSVEELRLLLGMTDALFARLSPLVTVYSQSAWIDPAFADERILAIFAQSDATARAALQRLQDVARGAAEPPPSPGVSLGHAFTITARIDDPAAEARTTRTAVVRLTGQPQNPVLIYRWD